MDRQQGQRDHDDRVAGVSARHGEDDGDEDRREDHLGEERPAVAHAGHVLGARDDRLARQGQDHGGARNGADDLRDHVAKRAHDVDPAVEQGAECDRGIEVAARDVAAHGDRCDQAEPEPERNDDQRG